MENASYTDVIGNPDAPYINSLATRYTLLRQMYAVSHPSLPNYLALISGSTQGCNSDECPPGYDAPTLAGQLAAAHLPWAAYLEGLPDRGYTGGDVGAYVARHDPFVYFREVTGSAALSDSLRPLDEMLPELASPPAFSFVVPDDEHNMHDGPVSAADTWARQYIGAVLASRAFRDGGLLILTWDEGERSDVSGCCVAGVHGGHIATIAATGRERVGSAFDATVCAFTILRTIEDAFDLPSLGAAAAVPALPQRPS